MVLTDTFSMYATLQAIEVLGCWQVDAMSGSTISKLASRRRSIAQYFQLKLLPVHPEAPLYEVRLF
jgi:hypothetical protein